MAAVEPYPGQTDLPLDQRLSGRINVERMLSDLIAAADRLGHDRIAVLGFCQGGMSAFRAAGTLRFDRAVAFYGMVRPPEPWSVPGADPLDMLSKSGAAPTLAIVAGQDRWAPPGLEALAPLPTSRWRSIRGRPRLCTSFRETHGPTTPPKRGPASRVLGLGRAAG